MSDLKIWKAESKIEYPAAANLFDKRGVIATRWQWELDDLLSEWLIANNRLMVHDVSKSVILTTVYNHASVSYESPKNYYQFSTLAKDFLSFIVDTLEPKRIDTIKMRLVYLAERNNFKNLVHAIRRGIYGLSNAQWDSLGGFPEDLNFSLKIKLNGDKVNFQLGPMVHDQISKQFNSSEVKGSIPPVVLYVSYELYRDNPRIVPSRSSEYISEFLDEGFSKINKSLNDFIDQFGGFDK